jgi:Domain of unknown function (DUF4302)
MKITKYIVLAATTLLLVQCTKEKGADPIFDKTPSERLVARKAELRKALQSSEFGWKAIYYTDKSQMGGFTFLFKFKDDKLVDMASDFTDFASYDPDPQKKIQTSEYDVQLANTIALVFTTQNKIHMLSDSNNAPTDALIGQGYKGDFIFLYYGQDNGDIVFKTNRDNIELRFVKAKDSDWAAIDKNIAMIPNVIGGPSKPLFRSLETNDGTGVSVFDFNYGAARFANSYSIDSDKSYSFAVAYTPTGFIASPPLLVGNQSLYEFTYDKTTDAFVAKGTNNVTATIKYSSVPLVLTDDYKMLLPGNRNLVYAYINSSMNGISSNSYLFNTLFADLQAKAPVGYTCIRIQPWFNNLSPNGKNYIEYRFATIAAPTVTALRIYHFFNITSDEQKHTITIIPTVWKNSSLLSAPTITAPLFLKPMDDQLTNSQGLYFIKESSGFYTLTSTNNPFRMTMYSFQ